MKTIGIIGGIGSGKSEVTAYLAKHYKAYVIIADLIGHEILLKGNPAYQTILQKFGSGILNLEGEINRAALGDIVFHDTSALTWLNDTTHPLIYQRIVEMIQEAKLSAEYDFIVLESAIMTDPKWLQLVDMVWLITCSDTERIKRLVKSRPLTQEKIQSILANQKSEIEYKTYADIIIDNSYDLQKTYHQVKLEITKVLEA